MTHHIIADRLVESAIKAVTEELFRDSDNILRPSATRKTIAKPLFVLYVMRVSGLHILCGYISKEEAPESCTQICFLYIVIGYIIQNWRY